MIRRSEDGKRRVLSLSYGKDSLACLGAIEELGLPLDEIVHVDIWATYSIPADLPEMVEFKATADRIILDKWGYKVRHICAMNNGKKLTYEDYFYRPATKGENIGVIRGFPQIMGNWCTSRLKTNVISKYTHGSVAYIGIAADEPERIARHCVPGKILPLVLAGWDEAKCRKWCAENELLSPIYSQAARGGCWFCHNQGVNQLRLLRKQYPQYWDILLKWDSDSPRKFKPGLITVHDFDKRFRFEDDGIIDANRKFRWQDIGVKVSRDQIGIFDDV